MCCPRVSCSHARARTQGENTANTPPGAPAAPSTYHAQSAHPHLQQCQSLATTQAVTCDIVELYTLRATAGVQFAQGAERLLGSAHQSKTMVDAPTRNEWTNRPSEARSTWTRQRSQSFWFGQVLARARSLTNPRACLHFLMSVLTYAICSRVKLSAIAKAMISAVASMS